MALSGTLLVAFLGALCVCATAYPAEDSDLFDGKSFNLEDVNEELAAEMDDQDEAFNPSVDTEVDEEQFDAPPAETEASYTFSKAFCYKWGTMRCKFTPCTLVNRWSCSGPRKTRRCYRNPTVSCTGRPTYRNFGK